jgi:hypothetical protein
VRIGLELKNLHLESWHSTTSITPFYFGNGILPTICTVGPETTICLISASQVARITGISHQYPAKIDI